MQEAKLSPTQLRLRLNALLRAYFCEEGVVKGQPMTREEIVTEIRTIKAALDAVQPIEETMTPNHTPWR